MSCAGMCMSQQCRSRGWCGKSPTTHRSARSVRGSGRTASACWSLVMTNLAPACSTAAPPETTTSTLRMPLVAGPRCVCLSSLCHACFLSYMLSFSPLMSHLLSICMLLGIQGQPSQWCPELCFVEAVLQFQCICRAYSQQPPPIDKDM